MMRVPTANILYELTLHDAEHGVRGCLTGSPAFAQSADERHYGAELLGRAIGHEAAVLATARLRYTADDSDTPEDVAAASAAARWQAYADVRRAVRPAVESFDPVDRLTIAADACRTAGL
jgi:hypothetical protein